MLAEHTDLIEARGRPLIVAKRWRCSRPDNASQRMSNYKKYKIQEKVRHFFFKPFLFETMSIHILLKTCSKLEMHSHKEREREREREVTWGQTPIVLRMFDMPTELRIE